MKKSLLIVLLMILIPLNISFANAIVNETRQVNTAYNWLEDQVRNNWESLKTLQHEFALLAIDYKTDLKTQGFNYLRQRGYPLGDPFCWGELIGSNENQCRIKQSAIASFIYNEFGYDYSKINEWLLNQSSLFTNIHWYLQVDIERGLNASCNVTYEDGQDTFKINENKKIKIEGGVCLSSYQNYWLEINNNCYDKDFKLTCQISDPTKTYRVGFLYKKNPQDNEWHASDFSYNVDSGGYVDVSIKDVSICLAEPQGQCNYESNALAAYVLKQEGNEQYAALMPYLIINAQTNANKNSYAWLYLLTGNDEYGDLVLNGENIQGFWNSQSGFGQFYDTAISGYSLIRNYNDYYNVSETKDYLLRRQNNQGYWLCNEGGCDKIRDTALLLYVFWPKTTAGGGAGSGGNRNQETNACEEAGGICDFWCNPELGFIEDPSLSYDCGNALCCKQTTNLSCYDSLINGEICNANENCINGYNIITTETLQGLGYCCYNGTCQVANQTCYEQGGYICDQINSFCPQGYEIGATGLSEEQVCCEISCQSCSNIGGKICGNDEICQGQNLNGCCLGDCIKNDQCSNLGGEPCGESGWSCNGELIKTIDTDYCCVNGACVKTCSDYDGGIICFENEECMGEVIDATDLTDGQICCIGECKKKAGFNWSLVILFLILISIVVGGYFFYKKGKFKSKKYKGKPPAEAGILKGPTRPISPPILPRQALQLGVRGRAPPIKPRPLPQIRPVQMPKIAEKSIEISKEKQKKVKSETEEQLEKILKKIKELTK